MSILHPHFYAPTQHPLKAPQTGECPDFVVEFALIPRVAGSPVPNFSFFTRRIHPVTHSVKLIYTTLRAVAVETVSLASCGVMLAEPLGCLESTQHVQRILQVRWFFGTTGATAR